MQADIISRSSPTSAEANAAKAFCANVNTSKISCSSVVNDCCGAGENGNNSENDNKMSSDL